VKHLFLRKRRLNRARSFPQRARLWLAAVWLLALPAAITPGSAQPAGQPPEGAPNAAPTVPDPVGILLWLEQIPDQVHIAWTMERMVSMHLPCGDAACVADHLRQIGDDQKHGHLPVYLVGRAEHTDVITALYTQGLTRDLLAGAILFRVDPEAVLDFDAGADSPHFLALVEHSDEPATVAAARRMATHLRSKGAKSLFLFASDGMLAVDPFNPTTGETMMFFMGYAPRSDELLTLLKAYARWQAPPFDNDAFWRQPTLLRKLPVSESFRRNFRFHYRHEPHQIKQMAFESMTAFDLVSYQTAIAPDARYVRFDNRLGTVFVLDLEQYAAYDPVIVVGLDYETNMYRFPMFYRTNLMYSWKTDVQNLSVQPLGPRLEFLKPLPEGLAPPPLMTSALTFDGISFSKDNPLAAIKDYPDAVKKVITQTNKCVYCHGIANVGARAHHLDALSAEPQGGFALPLSDYSPEVMTAFLMSQEDVAKKIGMTPNSVPEPLVDAFLHWTQDKRSVSIDGQ